ncbi:SIP domain-containing protein [Actinomadura sp. B10D3]|uniref:SIP domain-containing protein n=1 Tax=Actinomadura sp. B10D3 TaxID=3153557 RepID=UPI00325D5613
MTNEAGEARTVQAVRAHLVRERGWPRRSVLVKPFWTPGKRGMERSGTIDGRGGYGAIFSEMHVHQPLHLHAIPSRIAPDPRT